MKRRYLKFIGALFLVIFAFLVSLLCLPFYKLDEHKIVIEANGIVNDAALADGVQIQRVNADGQDLDMTDIFQENDWHYENGMFTWNSYAAKQNHLETDLTFRKADFYFLENAYCGAVTCYVDGKKYFSKDLYSAEIGCCKLTIKGEKQISVLMRLFISLSIAGFLMLLWKVVRKKMNLPFVRKWILFAGSRIRRSRIDALTAAVCILLLIVAVFNLSAVIENRTIEESIEHDIDLDCRKSLSEIEYVKQDIDINAKTTQLGLYFYKEDFFNGCIHVWIYQDDQTVYEKNIYADSIGNDSKCLLDISGLHEGKYTVFVKGANIDNNNVSLVFSRQKIFDRAQIDGESYDGNAALSLKTRITPKTHGYRVFLTVGMFAVIGIVLWNMRPQKRKASVFYICAVFLNVITVCIRFPLYSITPEAVAETGSNFYQMTYLLGTKDSICLDDAGYWPLFQRLISVFIIHVLHQQRYAVFLMQGVAVLSFAFAFSRFCLKNYRNYAQNQTRFAVSLAGGTVFAAAYGESCLAFHNFTYLCIVLIFFNMMLDLEQLNRISFVFITVESALLCLSKGRYGVLFPLYVLVFIGYLIKKAVSPKEAGREQKSCKRQIVYMAVVAAGAFVQTMYMLKNTAQWDTHTGGLAQVMMAGIYYFVQAFATVFIPFSQLEWNGWIVHTVLILLLMGFGTVLLRKWKKEKNICGLITVILIFIMGSSMLNAIMQSEYKNYAWEKLSPLPLDRTNIFMVAGVVFIIFLFCRLVQEKRTREWIFSVLLVMISIRFTALKGWGIYDHCFMQADWRNDYHQFQNESYVIPLGDVNRFVVKNAYVFYLGAKSEQEIDTSKWNYTTGPDVIEKKYFPYSTSSVFETTALRDKSINSIYARKLAVGMEGDISAVLYDKNGTLLCRQKAQPAKQRLGISFVFDAPVSNASRIELVDQTGKSVEVRTDLWIGVCEKEN